MFKQCVHKLAPAAMGAAVILVLLTGGGQTNAAGLLSPRDGGVPALSIKDHAVKVLVEDGYAVTTVEQVFRNTHDRVFEAIYSFPVPEKAAVAEFTYWINGQPVSGEVLAKKRARKVYEEEKAAGHEAGLAEQDGYKTFDISVWPVTPGQDTRIRLRYMQPAHIDTGVGRYLYPLEDGGVDENKLSFWTANDKVTGSYSFDLHLRPAYPVAAVRLPNHPGAAISQNANGAWHIHLDNGAATAREEGAARPASGQPTHRLDKDIAVYWRQQAGLPGSIDLVPYKETANGKGTFMMVLTPGDDLKAISEGRDWVFVLDTSGSMSGKFQSLVQGISEGLAKFRPEDRFRIITFDGQARDLSGGFLNATAANVKRSVAGLQAITPNNSTNLYAGLAMGLKGLDSDRSSGIVLVTDGVANVGHTDKRDFLNLVGRQDVRLFTMIMGNSANRPLLQAIAKESGGHAMNVSNSDDTVGAVLAATSKLTHEAMHDVEVAINGVRTADITPKRIGSLYRGQQLVLFGHYWGQGEADVQLTAKVSGKPVNYRTHFTFPDVATRNPEIHRLWSFAAIEDLQHQMDIFGETADVKQAVTDLAVDGGLVTPYTSMVVLREDVFAARGINRGNAKRLKQEQQARDQRKSQPVQSRRVDQSAPAFSSPRATYSGGGGGSGAFDPLGALLVLGLAVLVIGLRHREGRNRA